MTVQGRQKAAVAVLKLERKALSFFAALKDLLLYGYVHTHERVNPDVPNANFLNHLKVYKFAAQFCHPDSSVLDIGCGTGYGSEFLSGFAREVTGIDNSSSALRFARRRYGQRLSAPRFLLMNAECLEFPAATFDFIISTENFEHLHDHRAAAREMARVVKPDGLCLLATPNVEMFGGVRNRFHTHEFTFDELQELLQSFFSEVVILENSLSKRKDRGIRAEEGFGVWGRPVNIEHLSNTHSFFCFLKGPSLGVAT
jgi:SAM-dependent methyltransferase